MSLLAGLLIGYGALGLIALRPLAGHLAYMDVETGYDPEWGLGIFLAVVLCAVWPAALVGGAFYYLVRPFRVGAERRARRERERKVEESRIAELERETGVVDTETTESIPDPQGYYPETDVLPQPFTQEWHAWYAERQAEFYRQQAESQRQQELNDLWDRIKP